MISSTRIQSHKGVGKIHVLMAFFILMLSFLTVSCAEQDALPDFTPLLEEEPPVEEDSQTPEVSPFAKSIRIVLSKDRSLALYERVLALGDSIEEQTGIPYTVVSAEPTMTYRADTYDLVIGASEHPDSVLRMRGLKKDDYLCAVGRHAAVLGGRSETATFLALDRFSAEILPFVSPLGLMEEGVRMWKQTEYARDFVSWNGVELSEYSVSYGVDAEEPIPVLASAFCETVERISGYEIELTEEPGAEVGGRTIRLSIDPALGQRARLLPTDGGFLIEAGTGVGLRMAMDAFAERLFLDEDGDGSCMNGLERAETMETARSKFSLGLVIGSPHLIWDSPEKVTAVTDWILGKDREGVFVSELSVKGAARLYENLTEYPRQERVTEEGIAAFFLPDGGEDCSEDGDTVMGAYRIGDREGGFLWLTVKEGTVLPAWVGESEIPLLITVYGQKNGRLDVASEEGLDRLEILTVTLGEEQRYVSVYATVGRMAVSLCQEESTATLIDLTLTRLY